MAPTRSAVLRAQRHAEWFSRLIWMAGAGPASDGSSIYVLDGNGTFDTTLNAGGFPARGDFGNSYLKLGTTGSLSVTDYFAMDNVVRNKRR